MDEARAGSVGGGGGGGWWKGKLFFLGGGGWRGMLGLGQVKRLETDRKE